MCGRIALGPEIVMVMSSSEKCVCLCAVMAFEYCPLTWMGTGVIVHVSMHSANDAYVSIVTHYHTKKTQACRPARPANVNDL